MNHFFRSSLPRFLRLSLCACPLVLGACGSDIKETLGLGKEAPDEFVVVSRPPLTVPPDFELRPPSSGADKPSVSSTENDARKTLLGTGPGFTDPSAYSLQGPSVDTAVAPVAVTNAPTGATASFLTKAGANDASPDIRATLGADAKKPEATPNGATLYDQMVGKERAEPVVNAKQEAARIQENKAEGKPVTDGDTPVESTKPPSVLDRIF